MTATLTTPIAHVRALWRPEQFNHVTNPGFETNTTGWVATAGINDAGTSITRITSDFHSGTACASIVTTAAAWSGVNYDFGATPFYQESVYGTTYVAVVWLKWVSGARQATLILGSLGTSSDQGRSRITDLQPIWRPYIVQWMPSATRTDVELAITNDVEPFGGDISTFLVDDVTVYQVDAFSQVENSNFTADTSGWLVTAGINAAGTSITRGTGDGFAWSGTGGTQTYATLVTTGTLESGANYDFGLRKFTSGRTYRARVAMKSVSGTTSARIALGSLATGADRAYLVATITTSWAWYLIDWTPSGDRTDVELAVMNGAAAVMTARVSAAEVYEAIDEINGIGTGVRADVSQMAWERGTDGTGTLNLVLADPRETRRYTPWNTSGPLYGMLEPGRRVWARATYGGTVIYPVSFGTIRRIIPDATAGTAQIMCEDPMYDIARSSYAFPFTVDRSYKDIRAQIFATQVDTHLDLLQPSTPAAGSRRTNLTTAGPESGNFYMGTNGPTNAADILDQLNEATGTAHYIAPDARAEVLWRYSTEARSDLTDAASSDETIDDDFFALDGTGRDDETLENSQVVSWQAYELLPCPSGILAIAMLVDSDPFNDEDNPYLHFTDDRFGTDESIPEPAIERTWRWETHRVRRRKNKGRKKIRVRTEQFRRVYPDAFVPHTVPAGQVWTTTVDFSVAVADVVGFTISTPANIDQYAVTPRRVVAYVTAPDAAVIVSYFALHGTPYLPLDEVTETRNAYDQQVDKGVREGPSFNTPYIGGQANAQGLGDHRNWRYSTSRLTPTLTVQHRFPAMLQRNPTEHLTVNAALFSLSGRVFVINKLSGSVDTGSLLWSMDYELEELPASIGTLFIIGTSALGGAHVIAY